MAFYQEVAIHEAQSVDLDGLISTYEHNRDHFQKMVASLIPILSMLTSDPLQELLSPDFEPGHERLVTDMSKIIRGNKVVYIGLDSLADSTVGSAIGSIMLADLAAVAGDRYNYGIDTLTPVNLFIDEAAEVLNQPAIQLMNKGGGADFRVTIATQTFADFASKSTSPKACRRPRCGRWRYATVTMWTRIFTTNTARRIRSRFSKRRPTCFPRPCWGSCRPCISLLDCRVVEP